MAGYVHEECLTSQIVALDQEMEVVEEQTHKRLESAWRLKEIYDSYPGFVS